MGRVDNETPVYVSVCKGLQKSENSVFRRFVKASFQICECIKNIALKLFQKFSKNTRFIKEKCNEIPSMLFITKCGNVLG